MWLWLTSGLFLGWSVGANVGANVFATAVASGMVRFTTMIKLAAIFVILGGVVNGPTAMDTLGKLGGVDTLPRAFGVALASAVTMTAMTALGLPVSAAQTAVGALVGYQFFRQGSIGTSNEVVLRTILLTWLCAPFLAAAIAFAVYKALAQISRRVALPLFVMDRWLHLGLIATGCYGAWAFGGNNMANVASFYVNLDLFEPWQIGQWTISQAQILALSAGVAIALGIATYSRRIMLTVGRDLVKLDALTALIAILSEALVVDFLNHTWQFGDFILPAIPVSISQTLVGSVLGLGIARGIHTIRLQVLGNIIIGWIAAPVIAAGIAYFALSLITRIG